MSLHWKQTRNLQVKKNMIQMHIVKLTSKFDTLQE